MGFAHERSLLTLAETGEIEHGLPISDLPRLITPNVSPQSRS